MPERDRPNLPDWAERDRIGDLAWIEENVHVFWPAAQQGYETYGPGAVVVNTTSRTGEGGNPFVYFPQEMIEQAGDDDTRRMVSEYDPSREFVAVLLKIQDRVSSYRLQVRSDIEQPTPQPPDLQTLT
jgi:hypothetical protein